MSEIASARDQASAKYQVSKPDFCGVVIEHHKAFCAGWDAACEFHCFMECEAAADKRDSELQRLTNEVARLRRALEEIANGRMEIMVGGVGTILNPPNNQRKAIGISADMMCRIARQALAKERGE